MSRVDIYTDGSFNRLDKFRTRGAIIVLIDGVPVYAENYDVQIKAFVDMWNVGGELWAAITGLTVAGAISEPNSVLNIYYDYKGIRELIIGTPKWKPKKPGSLYYVKAYEDFVEKNPSVKVNFYKVKAHTGNKYNELVDDLTRGDVAPELMKCYKGERLVRSK